MGAMLLVWLASSAGSMAEPSPTPGGLLQRSHSMRLEIRNGHLRLSGLRPGQRANLTLECSESRAKESLVVADVGVDTASFSYAYLDAQQQWSVDVQRSGQVLIQHQTNGKDGRRQIEYRQPGSGSVSLVVRDDVSTRTLTAPDLWRLLVIDREFCGQHLIPMLEKLRPGWRLDSFAQQIEQALLVRSATGRPLDRQVLGELIRDLGHPEFRRRQTAEFRLRRLGHQAASYLRHVDTGNLSAEQRYRLRQILRALDGPDQDTPERVAAWLIDDPGTWVALLDRDDTERRLVAAAHLEKLLERPLDFDALAEEPERAEQLARLRTEFASVPPAWVGERVGQPRRF
jgi:hypothetical protein